MAKTPTGKAADKAQSRRFIEAARELGCDEDEAAFDEKLRKVGAPKPPDPKAQKPKTRAAK